MLPLPITTQIYRRDLPEVVRDQMDLFRQSLSPLFFWEITIHICTSNKILFDCVITIFYILTVYSVTARGNCTSNETLLSYSKKKCFFLPSSLLADLLELC